MKVKIAKKNVIHNFIWFYNIYVDKSSRQKLKYRSINIYNLYMKTIPIPKYMRSSGIKYRHTRNNGMTNLISKIVSLYLYICFKSLIVYYHLTLVCMCITFSRRLTIDSIHSYLSKSLCQNIDRQHYINVCYPNISNAFHIGTQLIFHSTCWIK